MSVEVDGRVGRLLNDICRCHDTACKDAVICARYVQRESGRLNAASLRGGATECASLILDRSTP